MSQKIGLAPIYSTTLAVETQVKAGKMTSSPGLSPSIATERCSAVVQEVVAIENTDFVKLENFFSNCSTNGPCTTQPVFKGSVTASISSSPKKGLVIGIGGR